MDLLSLSSNLSAQQSALEMPPAVLIDSNFESSGDSGGLTIHKGDHAYAVELGGYHLTWHDAPAIAKDSSGLTRLQSGYLQAESDMFEGGYLDATVGSITRYLPDQSLVGSATVTGHFGGSDFGLAVSRQMRTDSLETMRKGIFSNDVAIFAKRKLFRGFKVKLETAHRAYSYRNSVNSVRLSPEYDFRMLGADLGFGYRVEDKIFAHHASDGYYNTLVSVGQHAFWHLSYVAQRSYVSLDVAASKATPESSPTPTPLSNFSGEGTGTIGWRLNKGFLVELNASGCDYPAKAWTEISTGLTMTYSF